MAATLALGATALLCLHDAGAHWELRASSASWVHVTIPSRTGRKPRPGIHIHRPLSLPDADRATHRGIPVTSVPRTLIDLAEVLPAAALARAIEQADALRLLDLVGLREALARQPRRRGSALVASAIDGYRVDVITRSELEARLLVLCTQHGLPAPAVNARVHGYEVDFLWPANRVIAETDGRRHHATHAAFERDRARCAADGRWLSRGALHVPSGHARVGGSRPHPARAARCGRRMIVPASRLALHLHLDFGERSLA